MIEARNIQQLFGAFVALRDISFHVPKGQIVGLVGPNGAGKTTTMKVLTGYLAPSLGSARVAGHDVVQERLLAQRHMGYLPENAPIYRDMLVQEYLLYMARLRGIDPRERLQRISHAVEACNIASVLARTVSHLSKGFRQRVGLAQALLHDPDILILDEPTAGLDPSQILDIRDMIRRMGERKTVILSTHILSEVEATCDRAIMIVAGEIHVDETMDSFRRGHTLRVRLEGTASQVRERFAAIEGVERVEALAEEKEARTFRLHTDARAGLMRAIGRLAREAGWTVTELEREHRDLEDIFQELRKSKEQAA